MILSINQPAYLPWIGYYQRIYKSDIHLILDDVQIELRTKYSFTNRNKIKSKNGFIYLTVPLETSKNKFPRINEAIIDNSQNWKKKHLDSIKQCYSKSNFFEEFIHIFEDAFSPKKEWTCLIDLIDYFNDFFLNYLDLKNTKKIYKASEVPINFHKNELILKYCEYFKTKKYLSGPLGINYLDQKTFKNREIKVIFDEFKNYEYPQINGDFLSHMSIIDLLFNLGDKAKEYIYKV